MVSFFITPSLVLIDYYYLVYPFLQQYETNKPNNSH